MAAIHDANHAQQPVPDVHMAPVDGSAHSTSMPMWVPRSAKLTRNSFCVYQVVDSNHSCWSNVLYWMDIVQLALQQTGGQPGPAAVAAAEHLMKEKHSIFLARWVCNVSCMESSPCTMCNPLLGTVWKMNLLMAVVGMYTNTAAHGPAMCRTPVAFTQYSG